MAKKNKATRKKTASSYTLKEHLYELGFATVAEYQVWCKKNGFNKRVRKSATQLLREKEYYTASVASDSLERTKRKPKMASLITKIYKKQCSHGAYLEQHVYLLDKAFNEMKDRKTFYSFLIHVEKNSKLLGDEYFIRGLISLGRFQKKWIRSVEDWKPNSHNRDRQFGSLCRHLLALYDVPSFMDYVWFGTKKKQQQWFIYIGQGMNVRKIPNLPVTLTKKMAHCFMQAPVDYSIYAALRWGQVMALGGDKRLVHALRETRLVRSFANDEFWLSVIRFFIHHPMLDRAQVNPIIDYIHYQKYQNQVVFIDRGVAEDRGPLQPGFSMKKRNPETLLKQVENWHTRLRKERKKVNLKWTRFGHADFELKEGRGTSGAKKMWRIRELLSSDELIAEGRAMHHCVSSYAYSCKIGRTSIWAMDREIHSVRTRHVTIELLNKEKRIVQVRGKRNRFATDQEKKIIRRWAASMGYTLSKYI